jgi:hypothetical protein
VADFAVHANWTFPFHVNGNEQQRADTAPPAVNLQLKMHEEF